MSIAPAKAFASCSPPRAFSAPSIASVPPRALEVRSETVAILFAFWIYMIQTDFQTLESPPNIFAPPYRNPSKFRRVQRRLKNAEHSVQRVNVALHRSPTNDAGLVGGLAQPRQTIAVACSLVGVNIVLDTARESPRILHRRKQRLLLPQSGRLPRR